MTPLGTRVEVIGPGQEDEPKDQEPTDEPTEPGLPQAAPPPQAGES